MTSPLSRFGGRRFLLTVGCGVVTSVLVWFGKVSDGVYSAVIIATVAAYITGGTAQKITQQQPGAPLAGDERG